MERLEGSLGTAQDSERYPLGEFREDDQVEYERRGEEGVFTGVVADDRVFAIHHDLGGVLV